jgi:transcriptional regulator with XRE-family HTH domain
MDGLKIGERIMTLRDECGESQDDVAKGIGESRETIRNWEVGTRKVKAESIVKLAKYFGVSSDYLLGLSDTKSTDESVKIACETTKLSEQAIKYITLFSCQSNGKETIEGLNMLLEDPTLYQALALIPKVANKMKVFRSSQHRNYDFGDEERKRIIDDLPEKVQWVMEDSLAAKDLTEELVEAHPELDGKVSVLCGHKEMRFQMQELVNSFTEVLEGVTGCSSRIMYGSVTYDNLTELL